MIDKNDKISLTITVAILGWVIPGGGYAVLKDYKRAAIIFVVLTLMFLTGLYVGSYTVIDTINAKAWYYAQIMFSPAVEIIARHSAKSGIHTYGRPSDIGQLYTSLAGMLNLVCIFKAAAIAAHGNLVYKKEKKEQKND
ncbi:MAG: DUF6677 family protein [Sedimentisphaeraceae bacterium JB056]